MSNETVELVMNDVMLIVENKGTLNPLIVVHGRCFPSQNYGPFYVISKQDGRLLGRWKIKMDG
jgi:hypothetical protein